MKKNNQANEVVTKQSDPVEEISRDGKRS